MHRILPNVPVTSSRRAGCRLHAAAQIAARAGQVQATLTKAEVLAVCNRLAVARRTDADPEGHRPACKVRAQRARYHRPVDALRPG